MKSEFTAARRRFLAAVAATGTAGFRPALAAPRPVVVLTSFQDELVSRFEAAFEKAHPEYRLQVIWRMPQDAAPYLRQPGQGGVDVYWTPSARTFAALAREGAWRKLPVARDGLPERIGRTALVDPQGTYIATELAGYGFALDTAALAHRNLPPPKDWNEVADPRYAGLVALPIPSRVGFAPPMLEIVLQAWGWEKGWALWSEIAANSVLVDRGSTFVTDEIASGRCAIGLSIDFFVNSAIANGAAISFAYPAHNGLSPANAAITAGSPNPEGARAFVDFLLSPAGQGILRHPDIRRLPVRPSSYASLPPGYYDPFAAAAAGGLEYDSEAARPRLALVAAVFEQMLVAPHGDVKELWQRLRRAEAAGKPMPAVRRLLATPPIDEATAADATLRRQFADRLEGDNRRASLPVEEDWAARCREQRMAARRLLQEAGA